MAIHAVTKSHLAKFWDDEFKSLEYIHEEFNDPERLALWTNLGYPNRFTGDMCDWRSPQPSWNQRFIDIFSSKGWKNIGTSYYRMTTGTVLPTHGDLYKRYVDVFNLRGRENTIRRAIVFLEDWRPGHYSEYMDTPLVDWRAGDTLEWVYDTAHAAANIGVDPRYTLQITGHI